MVFFSNSNKVNNFSLFHFNVTIKEFVHDRKLESIRSHILSLKSSIFSRFWKKAYLLTPYKEISISKLIFCLHSQWWEVLINTTGKSIGFTINYEFGYTNLFLVLPIMVEFLINEIISRSQNIMVNSCVFACSNSINTATRLNSDKISL